MTKLSAILLAILLGIPSTVLAAGPRLGQHAHTFRKRLSRDASLPYLLHLPSAYGKRRERWPLILYLHGGSFRGTDVERLRQGGLTALVEQDPTFPFIVVSPQCPPGEIWTDADALVGILDEVSSRYAVDRDRVYLTGHSMGGRGTWYLAQRYPDRFAAIAPMAGPATISQAWSPRLKDMPIWAFHGAKDDLVPLQETIDMVDALKKVGNEVKVTVYPDADHFILDTYENKELYAWFLQHRRMRRPRPPLN